MNDLEIQREAIIEIVGTQYDGREKNHKNLKLQQKLMITHQKDNAYDNNAVLILTEDNKELGYLPKGYASLYAPAIDSGKYSFTVDVVKTEPDSLRPILIVKILTEYSHLSEEDVESSILNFVQNIVNGNAMCQEEYLQFIQNETVDINQLVSVLNKARLLSQLCALSEDIIARNGIQPDTTAFKPFTKDSLMHYVGDMQVNILEVLKELQKAYIKSFDIEDDEISRKVCSEIRDKKRKFQMLNDLYESYHKAVEEYVPVVLSGSVQAETVAEESVPVPETASEAPVSVPETTAEVQDADYSERAFLSWLLVHEGVLESTAKQYIFNIHSIEKLYQNISGIRKTLLGTESKEDAKEMIGSLLRNAEYIDANERRSNSFDTALRKFMKFAEITLEDSDNAFEERDRTVRTVDFNNPQQCTYYKPVSLTFKGTKRAVNTWRRLYTLFLKMLCNTAAYADVVKSKTGTSLYGRSVDFVTSGSEHRLRAAIRILPDLYAEGNLSASDIVKHIKYIMEACKIDMRQIQIEYVAKTLDVSGDSVVLPSNARQFPVTPEIHENESHTAGASEEASESVQEHTPSDDVLFQPDRTKPFVLKDALIAIMSSDDPRINRSRGYKNGLTPKDLQKWLIEFYDMAVSLFEISIQLMKDAAFTSVGKQGYVLKQTKDAGGDASEGPDVSSLAPSDRPAPVADHSPPTVDEPPEQGNSIPTNDQLTGKIIELIRKNKDHLQYEDGFGAYEVKILLSNEGIHGVSEDEIEAVMSASDKLKETDDGYYVYDAGADMITEEANADVSHTESEARFTEGMERDSAPETAVSTEARHISLNLNGNIVIAYDYADALYKICEFAINYKPFRMARIAGHTIRIHERNVFYRRAVPVEGYHKLSNGLQVIAINNASDLQVITDELKAYCQISNTMITFLSR